MPIQEIIDFAKGKAEEFGAKEGSYIFRENLAGDALDDRGGYFGFIEPDEEVRGPYHDLSLTINPTEDEKPWHINICIGSSGFRNDYDLVSRPGTRRLFSRLVDSEGYCKSDFSDTETPLPKSIKQHPGFAHFRNTFKTYGKLYTAIQLLREPYGPQDKERIAAFMAAYAKLRDWPSNNQQRNAVTSALARFMPNAVIDFEKETSALIKERKFLVLQGPPGTGKTRLAKSIARELGGTSFFTQFHAETSFSDFVFGIRPSTGDGDVRYIDSYGTFSKAVQFALENPQLNVALIIDEINRANLSNVLGPVFYLFEHKMLADDIEIEIAPGLQVSALPANFYAIATMNTADRSLAVVDFALRRRFAWYTLKPQAIEGQGFYGKDFQEIQDIFEKFATTEELSLQPGQGYFLAASPDEMTNRVRYEIYPLIREYLQEGLLVSAREEFNKYFVDRVGRTLFE